MKHGHRHEELNHGQSFTATPGGTTGGMAKREHGGRHTHHLVETAATQVTHPANMEANETGASVITGGTRT